MEFGVAVIIIFWILMERDEGKFADYIETLVRREKHS